METRPSQLSPGPTTGPLEIPGDLESPRSKLIYLCLSMNGPASADDLCDQLNLDKGTVLTIAKTLEERGHIIRRNGAYRLS